ncbi:receptor-like protein kinase FERONIA [Prunus avium]|uniref:Receptor-like protein kinase FERONIA n=1 Tax=Prunus avium TaxID=42229 RepID=A0A6P5RM54_PRUAV|nr:receptor-like protein kinase FERONIA [Prunus avium]
MKKNVPILTSQLYLSLFLHIITGPLVSARDSPPIYTPVEDITVKCGYSGNLLNENDERYWHGDINSNFSPTTGSDTSVFRDAPHSYTVHQVSYTTARLSRSEFTYSFKLTSGQKFIRLYFNSVSYGPDLDRSKALFSVKASGFTLLHDFNTSVTADAYAIETIYREFCLNMESSEQSLNITFTPSQSLASPDAYAFINGIEIVSMPTNLYFTAAQSHGVELVGDNFNFHIENKSALETVYRINVGGNSLFFSEDTGMYRNWEGVQEEHKYLDDLSLKFSVLPQNTSIELDFARIAEYSAPKEVYQTGRSMGMNKTINKSYNLTWNFPVDPKFYYLVRLHFCEFETIVAMAGDRNFLIYIANDLAVEGADIIAWSGGNGRPVYRDYLVTCLAASESQKKVHLSIALRANPSDWLTNFNDAILNGLEIFKLNDTNSNLAGHNPNPPPMLTPKKSLPQSPETTNTDSTRTSMLAIIAGVVSTVTIVMFLGLILVFRRQQKFKDSRRSSNGNSSLPSALCHYFSLAEIKAATQNFSDICIIGRGGFGNVYKGYIDGGATPVAIKRLKPESSQGAHEFKTEIEMLSQLRHRHLVSLIGYCVDEREMILVYDFMDRGTLSDHLYHKDNPSLPWEQRLEICIGAARGLHYLHTGAMCTIIHRDVKSTNILLDEKWIAKVSDFGLSKMSATTMSNAYISTVVKGSFGYLDPEYYRRQQLSVKSDVYSFGVVLCEVLCGRPAVVRMVERMQMNLAEWAKTCHHNGTLNEIIDPCLKGKVAGLCFNKFVEIAMSCMHDNGIERPSMANVVRELEFALKLQRSAGDDMDFNIVENNICEDEVAFIKDKEGSGKSEQSCATNESIILISETIFSEINNPDGR